MLFSKLSARYRKLLEKRKSQGVERSWHVPDIFIVKGNDGIDREYSLNWLQKLFVTLEEPDASWGSRFVNVVIMLATSLSCICLVISTLPFLQHKPSSCSNPACNDDPVLCPGYMICEPVSPGYFDRIDNIVVILFSIDYFARVILCGIVPARIAGIVEDSDEDDLEQDDFDPMESATYKVTNAALKLRGMTVKDMEILFEELDEDKSGTMEQDELFRGLRKKGIIMSLPRLEAILLTADENGDGEVSKDEFVTICLKMQAMEKDEDEDVVEEDDDNAQPVGFLGIIDRLIASCYNNIRLYILRIFHFILGSVEVDKYGDLVYSHHAQSLWYILKPMTIVDFVAILPFYLQLGGDHVRSTSIVRVLRLARILRVLKLGKKSQGLEILYSTMKSSFGALMILAFFSSISVVLFGSILYFVESGNFVVTPEYPNGVYMRENIYQDGMVPTQYTSILISMYWAVVTSTTTGYGDMVPYTYIGRMLATFYMYTGVFVLALPISVIGNNFEKFYELAALAPDQQLIWSIGDISLDCCNATGDDDDDDDDELSDDDGGFSATAATTNMIHQSLDTTTAARSISQQSISLKSASSSTNEEGGEVKSAEENGGADGYLDAVFDKEHSELGIELASIPKSRDSSSTDPIPVKDHALEETERLLKLEARRVARCKVRKAKRMAAVLLLGRKLLSRHDYKKFVLKLNSVGFVDCVKDSIEYFESKAKKGVGSEQAGNALAVSNGSQGSNPNSSPILPLTAQGSATSTQSAADAAAATESQSKRVIPTISVRLANFSSALNPFAATTASTTSGTTSDSPAAVAPQPEENRRLSRKETWQRMKFPAPAKVVKKSQSFRIIPKARKPKLIAGEEDCDDEIGEYDDEYYEEAGDSEYESQEYEDYTSPDTSARSLSDDVGAPARSESCDPLALEAEKSTVDGTGDLVHFHSVEWTPHGTPGGADDGTAAATAALEQPNSPPVHQSRVQLLRDSIPPSGLNRLSAALNLLQLVVNEMARRQQVSSAQ